MAQSTRERYRVDPVRTRRRAWPFPLNIYQSAVGRKWVMALTGIGLVGFLPWLEIAQGGTATDTGNQQDQ